MLGRVVSAAVRASLTRRPRRYPTGRPSADDRAWAGQVQSCRWQRCGADRTQGCLMGLRQVGAWVTAAALVGGCAQQSPWKPITIQNQSDMSIRCVLIPPGPSTPWDSAASDTKRYVAMLAPGEVTSFSRSDPTSRGAPIRSNTATFLLSRGSAPAAVYWIARENVESMRLAVKIRPSTVSARSESGHEIAVHESTEDNELKNALQTQFPRQRP